MAKHQRRDSYEQAVAMTLLGEQLHRHAKLPTLDQLLAREAKQSDEELRAKWHHMANQAGLTMRPHNPKRYRIVRSYPKAS